MNRVLPEIALKYKTDKNYHEFPRFYEKEMYHLQDDTLDLLEIGIAQGESLKMWSDYFINGNIYGADINDKSHFNQGRIVTQVCNQDKPEDLINVFPGQMFDIIIDDGGHTMFQQQQTLYYMMPRLKPGGVFIVEDLHTSYMRHYNTTQKRTTLEMLLQVKKGLSDKSIETMYDNFCISSDKVKEVMSAVATVVISLGKVENNSMTAVLTKKK